MTLAFQLDLDTIKHDLHAKIQDCMYDRSARIVRQMDGRKDIFRDRQTDNAKTITPSADSGCKWTF